MIYTQTMRNISNEAPTLYQGSCTNSPPQLKDFKELLHISLVLCYSCREYWIQRCADTSPACPWTDADATLSSVLTAAVTRAVQL